MIKKRVYKVDLDLYPDDFSPIHKQILSARNITPDGIKKPLSKILPISCLLGTTKAAKLIAKHIDKKSKIIIVGDYDADGATATALVVKVLGILSDNIEIFIPNRINMGYGLSMLAAKKVLSMSPKLVITVDNGITAIDSVELLRENHIDVIITDHHLPLGSLPKANIIVNPNQPECSFESKSISGVGVAFYVMFALYRLLKDQDNNKLDTFDFTSLLELVAIGTIADVVTLDYNNRILVEQGLKRIRSNKVMPGILALIEVSNLKQENINSTEIAFQIAPKINAAGRISDMTLGVDCLLATNKRLACDYAMELAALNQERKAVENEMNYDAEKIITTLNLDKDNSVICLYNQNWHEGIIGIIASRIKQRYKRPVFIFTRSLNGLIKGSARSIEGISVIDILNKVNQCDPRIIHNYGGHKMAAGISVLEDNYNLFQNYLKNITNEMIDLAKIEQIIYTDGELSGCELSIDNADFLKTFEVWGSGIPEPLFCNRFYLDRIRLVGKNHAKMLLLDQKSGKALDAIAFDRFNRYSKLKSSSHNMAYRLTSNIWQGEKKLSLLVEHIEVLK